uniref:Cyclic nucleotide-binding domain-containing protein n=1 Tax=Percolomonas cosmopolitus TaxID=63605 RepID=A0A7S1PFC1_9EUKA|mmetsp:Transcript_11129/g.41570  ORF Transcript_11129/g.41570 Transcript_11129/m.41570 type:complete len:784 (+) Transcript_11129:410-2761(+)|eukprot:CAMPEP_0117443136 /NCGR_PEP_ID=MMETSP0759-20121206/4534_1 /TAXON_ID=63605 /ORGANISM="Percolomonas cosmopolitus, Strain WS" /LENGTH=783 /DNA_ID=CAMNT_0005235091 /DNA_START=326 /DNA_END=2677 /DNA_ORIENTATION=+
MAPPNRDNSNATTYETSTLPPTTVPDTIVAAESVENSPDDSLTSLTIPSQSKKKQVTIKTPTSENASLQPHNMKKNAKLQEAQNEDREQARGNMHVLPSSQNAGLLTVGESSAYRNGKAEEARSTLTTHSGMSPSHRASRSETIAELKKLPATVKSFAGKAESKQLVNADEKNDSSPKDTSSGSKSSPRGEVKKLIKNNIDPNDDDNKSIESAGKKPDAEEPTTPDTPTDPSKSKMARLIPLLIQLVGLPFKLLRFCSKQNIRVSQALTNPERKLAHVWVCLLMFVALYNFVGVTFRCSFLYLFHFTWYSQPLWLSVFAVLDAICDLLFIYDIFLGFCTPYTGEDGLLVFDTKRTARRYLSPRKGWFWIDSITALPIDWVVLIFWPHLVPFFRLNRALRLVLKFVRYFSHFENYVNISASIIRILKFILIVILVVHVMACCWYLVSISDEPQNTIMWTNIDEMPFRPIWSIYLYACHWCLTTMIAYGGTVPASFNQVLYSEVVVCVGVSLFVTVIGTVGSLVTNLDSNASKNRQRLDEIKEYMKYRKLPTSLSTKIVNYYTFLFKSRKGWDEEKILNDLPLYLRMEVALDMNRKIVEKVELFKNSSRMFISSVVLSLMPRMTLPGAAIVRRGEIGREMYFIASGVVHILNPKDDKTVIVKLGEGSFFGEIAVIYDSLRSCTVRAGSYCDLYVLTKEAFERIEKDYPDQVRRIRELAAKRKEGQEKQRQLQLQKEEEARMVREEELKLEVESELEKKIDLDAMEDEDPNEEQPNEEDDVQESSS